MSSTQTAELANDPRVARGMATQLAARRRRIEAGDPPLGWKVGFGTLAAREQLGTAAPLVGHLMRSALIAPGARVSLEGWSRPHLEPEVAIHLAASLPAGSDDERALEAIGGLGPAFELADVEFPPADVEQILASNVYQRRVVLGPASPRARLDGTTARVDCAGEVWEVADPEAPTGPLTAVARHVADLLGAFDQILTAGDVIIAGSLVPPIAVAPGHAAAYDLGPLGRIAVDLGG